ncbi:hypothetical protein M514_21463, partial [Trichuris suis]
MQVFSKASSFRSSESNSGGPNGAAAPPMAAYVAVGILRKVEEISDVGLDSAMAAVVCLPARMHMAISQRTTPTMQPAASDSDGRAGRLFTSGQNVGNTARRHLADVLFYRKESRRRCTNVCLLPTRPLVDNATMPVQLLWVDRLTAAAWRCYCRVRVGGLGQRKARCQLSPTEKQQEQRCC